MFEQNLIDHHIQKYIMQILINTEYARYSAMRPEKTDSNLYSYHLKRLISSGYIEKSGNLYTLSTKGLRYVEYASSTSMKVRPQPKITTATLLKDCMGRVLLTKRHRQPYIGYYGLPLGKIHADRDDNIKNAACRELYEKTGVQFDNLAHIGDVYLKIYIDKVLVSSILAHVFSAVCEEGVEINETSLWVGKDDICNIKLVPGAREIIQLAESDDRFFKEISVWDKK